MRTEQRIHTIAVATYDLHVYRDVIEVCGSAYQGEVKTNAIISLRLDFVTGRISRRCVSRLYCIRTLVQTALLALSPSGINTRYLILSSAL